ncbi:hypothetical protein HK104_007017, partial [Borealophlyctis nickersoniae]
MPLVVPPTPPTDIIYLLAGHVIGCGDVRAKYSGRLIYAVQRRKSPQGAILFLSDDAGKPAWKISQRPGFRGPNYDLYERATP